MTTTKIVAAVLPRGPAASGSQLRSVDIVGEHRNVEASERVGARIEKEEMVKDILVTLKLDSDIM
jgi:hypothetical protein